MHQCRRLQRVVLTLAAQVGAGLPLEVLVDQRYQGVARLEAPSRQAGNKRVTAPGSSPTVKCSR